MEIGIKVKQQKQQQIKEEEEKGKQNALCNGKATYRRRRNDYCSGGSCEDTSEDNNKRTKTDFEQKSLGTSFSLFGQEFM